ncbi:MAG: S8 family serine peptidase [Candidatus Zixiibacteriota bacterium]
MKRFGTILFLALLLVTGSVMAQGVAKVSRDLTTPSFVGYVQDEFIVKFKPDVGSLQTRRAPSGTLSVGVTDFDAISAKFGVSQIRELFPGSASMATARDKGLPQFYTLKIQSGTVDEAVAAYKLNPMVEYAEPIAIHSVMATPNDGFYANQWHLNRANDADVDAPEAWDIGTGSTSIIIADLDTGLRYYHKDLGGSNASSTNPTGTDGNVWINTAEKNGVAGVDDDGNGYVDDWVGWDFVTGVTGCWSGEDCSTADNDPRDFNGHGTHTGGLAAAISNNGYAVASAAGGWLAGVQAPTGNGVKVMGLRIGYSASYLGQEAGFVRMDFAASAFYYAAAKGAKIATCSWGASNTTALAASIDNFLAQGGLIFKAAGNDGTQTADYMCARTDIISVAATDTNDCKADFSTYGTWVDVSAPGTGIVSTYHLHSDAANDYVATLDGTSMATPLAASVAALLWSKNPTWTAAQVRDTLYATCDAIDSKSCNTSYAGKLGRGRVNAFRALQAGGTPCDVAAGFTGTPTTGCAPLTTTFTDQSTGPVTGWLWTFGDGGTSTLQSPSHQYTVAGTYTVSLKVTSASCTAGNTFTRTNYVTVTGAPTANFIGSPTSGYTPLTVAFTDQSTGGPTSWSWTFGDGGTSTLQSPGHQYTVAGTYTVALTATNACGNNTLTRTNYITVTTPPAQQCDDFNDGNLTGWVNSTGTWTATGGAMKGNSNTTDAKITSPFGSFTTATIDCDVRMNTGRTNRLARIIFAYVNANTYRFIEADDINNRWRIYERTSGTNTVRATFNQTLATATWYHAQVLAAADGNVTLKVGGVTLGSYKFASATAGLVGCGFTRANSDFDNFCVGSSVSGVIVAFPPTDEPAQNAVAANVPAGFDLSQNYPNPFNPTTNINFSVPATSHVTVEVFNILGQRVVTLFDGDKAAGTYTVTWNSRDESGNAVSSGIYFYRLVAGETVINKKMMLLK